MEQIEQIASNISDFVWGPPRRRPPLGTPPGHSAGNHQSEIQMKSITIIILFFFLSSGGICAAPFQGKGATGDTPAKGSQKTAVTFAKRALQGVDMRVWISNQMTMGLEAWDCGVSGSCIPEDPPYGLEYPAGSGMEHLYGGGPAIAGKVDGARRVSEGYNLNNRTKNFLPDPDHPLRELIWRTSVADSVSSTKSVARRS